MSSAGPNRDTVPASAPELFVSAVFGRMALLFSALASGSIALFLLSLSATSVRPRLGGAGLVLGVGAVTAVSPCQSGSALNATIPPPRSKRSGAAFPFWIGTGAQYG